MRGTLLQAEPPATTSASPGPAAFLPADDGVMAGRLDAVRGRITRGVRESAGLRVGTDAHPRRLAVRLADAAEAARFAAAVRAENVAAEADDAWLLLPLSAAWTAEEIDHVVLATTKVRHYLRGPLPAGMPVATAP